MSDSTKNIMQLDFKEMTQNKQVVFEDELEVQCHCHDLAAVA